MTSYLLSQLDAMYGTVGLTDTQLLAVNASGGRDKHLVEISEPYNITTKLKIRGYELTWQQPLDMLPVKGFGFTANYTYTKQTDTVPECPAGGRCAAQDHQPDGLLRAQWLELPCGA